MAMLIAVLNLGHEYLGGIAALGWMDQGHLRSCAFSARRCEYLGGWHARLGQPM